MLHKPVLSLSRFFKQHRQAYYEHLQAVRDSGAWEEWLAFFLRGVIAVATERRATGISAKGLSPGHDMLAAIDRNRLLLKTPAGDVVTTNS